MARTKSFNPDAALLAAMDLFWERGYRDTSMADLLGHMGISRQSLYDTFGDKRALFVKALEAYSRTQGEQLESCLMEGGSARLAITSLFLGLSSERPADRLRGCLMVNTVGEGLVEDGEVANVVRDNTAACRERFAACLRRGQSLGELDESLDVDSAADFLFTLFQGLRVSARAGASPLRLRETATMALERVFFDAS